MESCLKDDPANEDTDPPVVVVSPVVTPPFPRLVYADNYISISSWNSGVQWNLANVHDPTV
ncbi:hypothetical protein [Flavobacterium piscis]|uniref:Uncharacterized protein n=1 Tax=Flavobacterium piscis TaxID=1114874 RepID=A0ABU1Y2V1_9FLAO|nr:hypothetical protein [Flavobacterium piscis]MDR7208549.1 hypothetical protein [Flavobacterium piscis]